ncbi:MAG: tyrosine-type recombinase/integrase [Pyrinomonadaceae bacterium]|nr:tyrosine-type recombinase/integrase [Pyrinomonadaceae bacterium]
MNEAVRFTLEELVEGAEGDEFVFSIARNGVSLSTLRSGFMKGCELAGITYGTKQIGGINWHDLRHTFATRLEQGIHQLEIMDLMGHSSQAMVKKYAHQTPLAAQRAVDTLPQPASEVQDLTNELPAC